MDRVPGHGIVESVRKAAEEVPGVLAIEKLAVSKAGLGYRVNVHVQSDPAMPLDEAHVLSGRVKGAIQKEVPQVQSVLVHMEPYESSTAGPEESRLPSL